MARITTKINGTRRGNVEKQDWLDQHLAEIRHYQQLIEETPEDDLLERVNLLSKMLVLIGRVSARLSEDYKKIYATRKRVHAEAYIKATRNKAAEAELAVIDLRQEEAKAYGDHKRWLNAFESTQEEINALKYKLRVSMEDGSSRG